MGALSRRASRRTSISPAQALYRTARNFMGDFHRRDVDARRHHSPAERSHPPRRSARLRLAQRRLGGWCIHEHAVCASVYPPASRPRLSRLWNGDAGAKPDGGAVLRFCSDCRDVLCRDGIGTWYRRCRHYVDDDGNGSEALHGTRAEYVFLYRHIAAARDEHRGWSHRPAHFTRARFLDHRVHVWHRRDYGRMAGYYARESNGGMSSAEVGISWNCGSPTLSLWER